MPAYMIVEVETTDEALMAEYRKHTPGLVAKFGGKFIVRGGKTRSLEGGWKPTRVVVLEFPSYEVALACYRSAGYQAAIAFRRDIAIGEFLIIEGYEGPQPDGAQA